MLCLSILFAALVAPSAFASTSSPTEAAKRATCTVTSVAAAATVSQCSSVVIEAFTVPSGCEYCLFILVHQSADALRPVSARLATVNFNFATGASVTMVGDITFAKTTAAGPLISFRTS